MTKNIICICLVVCAVLGRSAAAQGDKVDRPQFHAGDTWTYRQTTETKAGFREERQTYALARATATALYVDVHQEGSSQATRSIVLGADWSRIRSVNGSETVVNQPVNFPLTPGKTWVVHYRENNPNAQHGWEDLTSNFVVVGHETVKVGAGEFDTIKIEAEGKWLAQVLASTQAAAAAVGASGNASMASTVSATAPHQAEGRTYKAVWYAPAVKRWVKSVEEYYGSGGERTERHTAELESYSVH